MKNTAILLISCPDRKGIVAAVSGFLYKYNANIVRSDEHQDGEEKLFFLRTEWDLEDFTLNKQEFTREFIKITNHFKMDWRIAYSVERQNVAVFLSKEEHCLADLLYRHQSGEINGNIKCIIGTSTNGGNFYGIPFSEIKRENAPTLTPPLMRRELDMGEGIRIAHKLGTEIMEQKILEILDKYKIDLVVLARFMKILSPEFLKKFNKPIINIHHSFLPAFVGAKPYHQAYERGVKIIGASWIRVRSLIRILREFRIRMVFLT